MSVSRASLRTLGLGTASEIMTARAMLAAYRAPAVVAAWRMGRNDMGVRSGRSPAFVPSGELLVSALRGVSGDRRARDDVLVPWLDGVRRFSGLGGIRKEAGGGT